MVLPTAVSTWRWVALALLWPETEAVGLKIGAVEPKGRVGWVEKFGVVGVMIHHDLN